MKYIIIAQPNQNLNCMRPIRRHFYILFRPFRLEQINSADQFYFASHLVCENMRHHSMDVNLAILWTKSNDKMVSHNILQK